LRLLIVRHARAMARGTRGFCDDDRPLTKDGAKEFATAASGLARIAPRPDVILTSPLLRARQTAEIARAAWNSRVRIQQERTLAQVAAAGVVKLLAGYPNTRAVALFGHEPGVSALLAHLIGAKPAEALGFKKGGAALVETLDPRQRGSGRLVWFLPPKLLSTLGGRR
jgi:phosphohistidine phosphatase